MSSKDTAPDFNDAPKPAADVMPKVLTPAAQRALAEAAERRAKAEVDAKALEAEGQFTEDGGPSGPEPTRFGDWERKGIAVDF